MKAEEHTDMQDEYDFSRGKRGALLPTKGKTRITIYLDDSIVDAFRARAEERGTGYQTMINDALRRHLANTGEQPVTTEALRRLLREELESWFVDTYSQVPSKFRTAARASTVGAKARTTGKRAVGASSKETAKKTTANKKKVRKDAKPSVRITSS